MPRKPMSTSQRIRNMLERGRTVKEICTTLDVKPQNVYNIRYQMNKAQGLGALPAGQVRATRTGIKRTRKPHAALNVDMFADYVPPGAELLVTPVTPTPPAHAEPSAPPVRLYTVSGYSVQSRKGEVAAPPPADYVRIEEPPRKPGLIERVRNFFRGAA